MKGHECESDQIYQLSAEVKNTCIMPLRSSVILLLLKTSMLALRRI
jgi:hypothetical protein